MLKIIRAGMYTSVQDGGREGLRQLGISHCGAMDKPALVTANLLVGNGANAAALEITLGQVDIQFERSGWFALTGAARRSSMASRYGWAGERRSRPGSIWCSRIPSTACAAIWRWRGELRCRRCWVRAALT